MRPHSWWNWLHPVTLWIERGTGVALVVIAASLKIDSSSYDNSWALVGRAVKWLQNISPVTLLILVLVYGLSQFVRKRISAWVWEMAEYVLDEFRLVAFPKSGNEPVHYHRVTLFQAVHWYWKWWHRYLIPVARSGHTTQRSNSVFRIPDDADRVEGVAGQTWALDTVLSVYDLPDLQGNPTEEQFNEYARRTFVTVEYLKQTDRTLPRSLCGVPVDVGGKRWGVIVVDSRSEKQLTQNVRGVYSFVGRMLGKLLERAGR